MWFTNKILRRIACFRHTHTKMACSQSCIAFSQVSGFLVGIKKTYVSDAKVQKFRFARSARSQPLMGFSRVSGRYKSSWTRPYNECYEHKDTLYRQTMWFTNTILRRIACFRHTQKKWLARKSQSFIAFSRVSGRYVKHFSDAKVQIFWLVLSARSISFFSSFLFLMNKTISRVLRTQSWTYCTDKQWLISNVYYWDLRRIVCFQRRYKKSARSLRSLAILYTFSPVSNASSFNKAIYHEHIKWTNTRTYCTDKNMLLTNLTIARFQRKIRKFRLARSQSVTYIFRYVL